MTARAAAALVSEGAVCLSTGMAGNGRCSALFWTIREHLSVQKTAKLAFASLAKEALYRPSSHRTG